MAMLKASTDAEERVEKSDSPKKQPQDSQTLVDFDTVFRAFRPLTSVADLGQSKLCSQVLRRSGGSDIEVLAPGACVLRKFLSAEDQLHVAKLVLSDVIDFTHLTSSTPCIRDDVLFRTNFGAQVEEQAERGRVEKDGNNNPTRCKDKAKAKVQRFPFEKLRWLNVGDYNYHWGRRQYEKNRSQKLHPDLVDIAERAMQTIANQTSHTCQFPVSTSISDTQSVQRTRTDEQQSFDFNMAVVNVYHLRRPSDRLGGHRDDVENDLSKPLVTCSLGVPGIFLLGGLTKEDTNIAAVLLEAGDVVVMAGRSRLCYHGVPTILKLKSPGKKEGNPEFDCASNENPTKALADLLLDTRINISIRNVS